MNKITESASDKMPFVGLYWYGGDKILEFYRKRADQAASDEIAIDTATGHIDYWRQNHLQRKYGKAYDAVPRGRILYNKYAQCYIVYYGEPLSAALKAALMKVFNLPATKTQFLYDSHYQTPPRL